VKRSALIVTVILLGLVASPPLRGQQARRPIALSPVPTLAPPRALLPLATVPDSIRQKTGYQHWKGAAIGGSVGALAGLVLALSAPYECDDCTSTRRPVVKASLIGGGLGAAFGFLVGLASPRYRWVPGEAQ
jgi:hypothetical protein